MNIPGEILNIFEQELSKLRGIKEEYKNTKDPKKKKRLEDEYNKVGKKILEKLLQAYLDKITD